MAVLSQADRADISRKFIQAYFAGLAKTADLTTEEIFTLVTDVDTWLDSQITQANNAISQPVRGKASSTTKFAALAYVAMKRGNLL